MSDPNLRRVNLDLVVSGNGMQGGWDFLGREFGMVIYETSSGEVGGQRASRTCIFVVILCVN